MAEETDLLKKVNEEAAKAIEGFKDEFKALATKAADGSIKKEDLDRYLKELETKISESLKDNEEIKCLAAKLEAVTEELKNANLELKNLKDKGDKGKDNPRKGVGTLLREALFEKGLIEEIVDTKSSRKSHILKGYEKSDLRLSVESKAAFDMTTGNTLSPGASPGTSIGYLTDYKMRDVQINLSMDDHVVAFIPTDPVSDKYMGVLVEYEYTDGSATKAEGSAGGKSSIKFKTEEFKVFTIQTFFRVSKEQLADIDRLESKLNRIAPDRIMSQLDSKVLSATGDNSSDIKGMFVSGNYTAFTASSFESTVEMANVVDLIRKMKLQAELSDQDVNAVILNPQFIDDIESLKDADRNYLQSRGIIYDTNGRLVRVHQLAVIKNKKHGSDKITVMWNESAEIGIREDINFEIGLNGDDFTEGMRTIVFEMRAAFGVGKPGAIIVSTDPETDIATIDKTV
jgi:hypothetical protein